METIYKILFLLLIFAGFFSCRTEEQKLVNQLDGSWELIDVYLASNTTENTPLPESGTITFDKCKISKYNISFCEGSHEFDGQVKSFKYQPTKTTDGEIKAFNILHEPPKAGDHFFLGYGGYTILELGRKRLSFEGNINVLDEEGESEPFPVTFVLEKQ
jgi:hypothetical protein